MPSKQAHWAFVLAKSSNLSRIGELVFAKNRSLQMVFNKPGSLSFELNLLDPLAASIVDIQTCVLAIRDGIILWSGPVWTVEDNGSNSTCTVSCQGWLKLLEKRLLLTKTTYTAQTPSFIAYALLALTNADQATWITAGSYTGAAQTARDRVYERYVKIGDEIDAMSTVEDGFDYVVTPDTRVLNIYDRLQVTQRNAVFGYHTGPMNLLDASRRIDGDTMCNRFIAQGKNVQPQQADDATDQAAYQLFEETGTLSDVQDPAVLAAFAGVEVIVRGQPRITYKVVPMPWTVGSSVPKPFVDYSLGDIVYFSADRGRFFVQNQACRVFAISLSIDETGGEHVSDLQFNP